jgi:chromosome segregation ATPase
VTVARRRLAVVAGSVDALYKDIEQKQQALDAAVAESKKLREDGEKARDAAEQASAERDKFRMERERFRSANEDAAAELEKLRAELTAANQEREGLRKRANESNLISSVTRAN